MPTPLRTDQRFEFLADPKHRHRVEALVVEPRGRADLARVDLQGPRDQLTHNVDYQGTRGASARRLNREQTQGEGVAEVVWSAGETLAADTVLKAFRLAPAQRAALQRDAAPTFGGGGGLAKVFLWIFIIAVLFLLFRCGDGGSGPDCESTRLTFGDASQEYRNCLASRGSGGSSRTGGGSFGGFSSGGGHK